MVTKKLEHKQLEPKRRQKIQPKQQDRLRLDIPSNNLNTTNCTERICVLSYKHIFLIFYEKYLNQKTID